MLGDVLLDESIMRIKHPYLPMKRSAIWFMTSAAFTVSALAQQNPNLQIDVTGSQESSNSILTPTKVMLTRLIDNTDRETRYPTVQYWFQAFPF